MRAGSSPYSPFLLDSTQANTDIPLFFSLGGGIVFDSDEYEEWMETINKLGANMHCITSAEQLYHAQQQRSA
jgi:anthranilate/para-aminobenzoate synthase component I